MSERRDGALHDPIPKAIWSLAWPIIVNTELTMVASGISLFWLARMFGEAGIAVDSLFQPFGLLLNWFFMSTAVGTSALVSRSVGAGDGRGLSLAAGATTLAFLMSAVLAVLVVLLAPQLAGLLAGSLPLDDAMTSFLLGSLLVALPATTISEVLLEVANATGNTRFNIARIAIDLAMMSVLAPLMMKTGIGIAGAPVALGVASIAMIALLWIALVRGRATLQLGELHAGAWGFRWGLWKEILAIGVPVQLGRVAMFAARLVLVKLVARDSEASVAGYGIASFLVMFGAMATLGLAQGGSILVGQSLGAELHDRARAAIRTTLVISWLVMAAFVCASFFDRPLIGLVTSDAATADAAHRALSLMRWGLFGGATWQIMLAGFAAHRATVSAGLLIIFGEGVGLAVAFAWPGSYLDAVSVAFIVSNMAKAALLVWLFARRHGRGTAALVRPEIE